VPVTSTPRQSTLKFHWQCLGRWRIGRQAPQVCLGGPTSRHAWIGSQRVSAISLHNIRGIGQCIDRAGALRTPIRVQAAKVVDGGASVRQGTGGERSRTREIGR
jgi:hypothetical protein